MASDSSVVLDLQDVSAGYGSARALSSVSLHVQRGERVFVLGDNGAGKTTLLRLISGLHPVRTGRVAYFGDPNTRMRADLLAIAGLSFVRERAPVMGSMSVSENVALGARLGRIRDVDSAYESPMEVVAEWFEILGVKSGQRADSLSGGQRQLLAISTALVSRPTLLVLDEPSTGLSPVMIDRVFEVIAGMEATNPSFTSLVAEQDARVAQRHSSRTIWLSHGRIKSGEVTTSPALPNGQS